VAKRVIIATNGYSSENIPHWMRARYLPVQSSILVTRPLSSSELEAANWTNRQACYDSRLLLHYFRLLPDNRFLFGMRGGLYATPRNEARVKRKIRQDFERMFPAWQDVDTPHYWSGLVAFSGSGAPFVGPIPEQENLWAGFGYHGNGVAMANYTGAILADLVQGKLPSQHYPELLKIKPTKFPFGRFRRNLLLPTYITAEALDL
jgi:glycine/D-amino acid oxidase-like deaminating enzyme